MKKLCAMTIAAITIITMGGCASAFTDVPSKGLCMGINHISLPREPKNGEWQGDYVYLGGIRWRMLSTQWDKYDIYGDMLLLADQMPGEYENEWKDVPYWTWEDDRVSWERSEVRRYLNMDFYARAFTGEERDAMVFINRSRVIDPEDKLLLPEPVEVGYKGYGKELGFNEEKVMRAYGSDWWLEYSSEIWTSGADGELKKIEPRSYESELQKGRAVRPIICLLGDAVIFSRDAAFPVQQEPSSVLMDFNKQERPSGEWVVMLSSSAQHVTVESVALDGNICRFQYSGASTGAGNYLSAAVLNEDGTEIFQYGRIADTRSSDSGQAEFSLPEKYGKKKKVVIFSERGTGGTESAYASEPVEILHGREPVGEIKISSGKLDPDSRVYPLDVVVNRHYDSYLLWWTNSDYQKAEEEEKLQAGTAVLAYQAIYDGENLYASNIRDCAKYAEEHPEEVKALAGMYFSDMEQRGFDSIKECIDDNRETAKNLPNVPEPGMEADIFVYTKYLDYTYDMYLKADSDEQDEVIIALILYIGKYRMGTGITPEDVGRLKQNPNYLADMAEKLTLMWTIYPDLTVQEIGNME